MSMKTFIRVVVALIIAAVLGATYLIVSANPDATSPSGVPSGFVH
jgi:hypothetical protein